MTKYLQKKISTQINVMFILNTKKTDILRVRARLLNIMFHLAITIYSSSMTCVLLAISHMSLIEIVPMVENLFDG